MRAAVVLSLFFVLSFSSGCSEVSSSSTSDNYAFATPPTFCGRRVCVTTNMPVASLNEIRGTDFSVYYFKYLIEVDGWFDDETFDFSFYEGEHPNLSEWRENRFCQAKKRNGVTLEGFRSPDSRAVSYLASLEYSDTDDFLLLTPTKAHFWFSVPPEEPSTDINAIEFSFFGKTLDFSICRED